MTTFMSQPHAAIQMHGSLPERREVSDRAERASYQPLDLLRAAGLLAARRFALGAGVGRARQHAVFGGDPAAPAVFQERRHALLHARGAQHPRVAERDQARALGVLGEAGHDFDGAHFVGRAAGRSHGELRLDD
jgi:hypothetical protein